MIIFPQLILILLVLVMIIMVVVAVEGAQTLQFPKTQSYELKFKKKKGIPVQVCG